MEGRPATCAIAGPGAVHLKTPEVIDNGRVFRAGGAVWRVYHVKYDGTGFRHVAETRQPRGEYLAIDGLGTEKKWSRGVPIGR